MSDKDFEQLSALLDDEAEWQPSFVKRAAADAELRGKWSRYSLARDAMHSDEYRVQLGADFNAKLSAALDAEPAIFAPKALPSRESKSSATVKRWAAGVAVAATVAGVTLVSLQQLTGSGVGGADQSVASNTAREPIVSAPVTLVSSPSNVSTRWVLPSSEAVRDVQLEQRLNGLYSQHVEQSGRGVVQGVLPYSRLVGKDEIND